MQIQDKVTQILHELAAERANVLELLRRYRRDDDAKLWRDHPELYRRFVRKLIGADRPFEALDLVRAGLREHPHDFALKYSLALALKRARSERTAQCIEELLADVDAALPILAETYSLAGSLRKERLLDAATPAERTHLAGEAAEFYRLADALSPSSFAKINIATMHAAAGDRTKAKQIADQAVEAVNGELQQARTNASWPELFWQSATLGEAYLIQERIEEAAAQYRQAVKEAGNRAADISSMRRNVQILDQAIGGCETILPIVTGAVVVFAGHMIDSPARSSAADYKPRLPNDSRMLERLRMEIRSGIDRLQATVGYCSAACGSDLIFAEEMLARGAELHIVLPFDRDDFYKTSVDFGYASLSGWRRRFDDVLSRAAEVHFATDELYLGDSELYRFVNTFSQGLAVIHAERLHVKPAALIVMEPNADVRAGGTASFLNYWKQGQRRHEIINLAELRQRVASERPLVPENWPAAGSPPDQLVVRADVRREVKVMLFSDVKGFSQMNEEDAPAFFLQFMRSVSNLVTGGTLRAPDLTNTWGDGLFLVFSSATAAAQFAAALLDLFDKVEWRSYGRELRPRIRIGLHAGPVYPQFDPLLGKTNYFGRHVNRAARIEPVTEPDHAFTSEQFAAMLATETKHEFRCEYVGRTELPKSNGTIPLYRLTRRRGAAALVAAEPRVHD